MSRILNRFIILLSSTVFCVRATEDSENRVGLPATHSDLESRLAPEEPDIKSSLTPEWPATEFQPPVAGESQPSPKAFAAIASAARQPGGALSGRIVFMNSGHG